MERWAVPLSVRASSWERFALPHRTPCKPPCRRSQEAALCIGAGRNSPRTHGFYHTSAEKMVFLLHMVVLCTLSALSGASAAAHREYLSPVCCSAPAGSRSAPAGSRSTSHTSFFPPPPLFLRMIGRLCAAGAAAVVGAGGGWGWGGTGAAVAPTLQTTFRVLLGFVLLFICVAAARMGKLLARTLSR